MLSAQSKRKRQKHTTGGIPRWSPTLVLVARFSAYVWQSGRSTLLSPAQRLGTARHFPQALSEDCELSNHGLSKAWRTIRPSLSPTTIPGMPSGLPGMSHSYLTPDSKDEPMNSRDPFRLNLLL